LKGFTLEAGEDGEDEELCAIATGALSANAPAIVAAPATPAARRSSRREGWISRIPGAGREVFALVSCELWSSSVFFILHLPLEEASIPWTRRIAVNATEEYQAEGLAQLQLFVKNFAGTLASAYWDGHGPAGQSA
jgi:hypothetical protein